jgi:hypothetical protein
MTASGFNIVTAQNFNRMFGNTGPSRTVHSVAELRALPTGCFIGFILEGLHPQLRHVMLHVGNGWGAGNKNDCIFRSGRPAGWERLDLAAFFQADAQFERNRWTRMVYAPVTGQTI